MQTKQEMLTELYCSKLAEAKIGEELGCRLSCPLMMSVLPGWEDAVDRILIVGQETLDCGLFGKDAAGIAAHDISSFNDLVALPNMSDAINALIHTYEVSMSGEAPQNEHRPFWKAFAKLCRPSDAALWSNLFWCSLDRGSVWNNSTWEDIREIYAMQRGRLKREIEVLNPTAVVFFTGPDYDPAIKDEFDDADWVEVNGMPIRKFSRIASSFLPKKSFRLYHPAYLQRGGHWEWLNPLEELIHEEGIAQP